MNIQHGTSATRRQQLHDKVVEIAARALSGWLQEVRDTGARTFWYFRCIGQLAFSSIDPRKCSPTDALRSCLSMFHRGLRTCTASYPKEAGRMRSPPEPEKIQTNKHESSSRRQRGKQRTVISAGQSAAAKRGYLTLCMLQMRASKTSSNNAIHRIAKRDRGFETSTALHSPYSPRSPSWPMAKSTCKALDHDATTRESPLTLSSASKDFTVITSASMYTPPTSRMRRRRSMSAL